MSEGKARLPEHYLSIKKRYSILYNALETLGRTIREGGPLDVKTGHLIQLAAAASIRSEGSVHSHTRRAIESGATPEEICHTVILLTSTIGYPTVAAALSWVEDVLGKK
jgi:alkylhydroperoxidase/carboxymuconolactone decarboxylase family protein YurZ